MAAQLPVYLINLPRDAERLRRMAAQLDALGLGYERIDAVLGRALGPDELAALYDPERNRRFFHDPLVPGEIGCYASHLRVWQRVIDSDAQAALVLEDDVILRPALVPVLRAVAALPPRWDMVKLIGRDAESPQRSWPLADGVELIAYRRVPSLTSAYIVSRRGAGKLLAHRRPFFRPVDTDLRHWWECDDLRIFGTRPYPVAHGDDAVQSSIGKREMADAFGHRWRKVREQWRYSLGNWRANRRLGDDDPFAAASE